MTYNYLCTECERIVEAGELKPSRCPYCGEYKMQAIKTYEILDNDFDELGCA